MLNGWFQRMGFLRGARAHEANWFPPKQLRHLGVLDLELSHNIGSILIIPCLQRLPLAG